VFNYQSTYHGEGTAVHYEVVLLSLPSGTTVWFTLIQLKLKPDDMQKAVPLLVLGNCTEERKKRGLV